MLLIKPYLVLCCVLVFAMARMLAGQHHANTTNYCDMPRETMKDRLN